MDQQPRGTSRLDPQIAFAYNPHQPIYNPQITFTYNPLKTHGC